MSLLAQARHRVAEWARARLQRSGYILERLPEHPPAGLEAHLQKLVAAIPAGGKVLYAGTSRRILDRLLAAGVAWTTEFPHSGTLALAIVDFVPGQAVAWPRLTSALDPHGRLLVRLPGASGIPLRTLEVAWEQAGLRMLDVAEYPRCSRPVEAIERITVLLAPVNTGAPAGPAARRLDELRTWVGGPVGGWAVPRRLAGPAGGPGWDAVLNPGAISQAEGTLLLCRVEDARWGEMKVNEAVFMRRCPPRLLQLDDRGDILSTREARWTAAPTADTHRLEDFRLFTHGGRILTNHAILQLPAPARQGHPVDLNRIKTRVGLSELDPLQAELRFLGEPSLPRALGQTEKNWACFSTGADLYLLYSPAPYRLYRCSDWDRLEFTAHSEADWILPGSSRELPPLRNSINPVVYDRDHLLHIVHRVYPGKRYAYWPVLICRRTLLPIQASREPLACGGWSGGDGLLYLSAAIARAEWIDLYFGAEDCATGHTQVTRRALDAAWGPVDRR